MLAGEPSILIAAAAGVNAENAARLVAGTGCCEVHAGSALAEVNVPVERYCIWSALPLSTFFKYLGFLSSTVAKHRTDLGS